MQEEINEGYQVMITAISWSPNTIKQFKSKYDAKQKLPDSMTFDIPTNVLQQAKASGSFNDTIESYLCNSLTRKFGHEVYGCQIWLPFD